MFMEKPFLSLLNMAYGPTIIKIKIKKIKNLAFFFFFGDIKRFSEVEDDLNEYGLIF